GFPGAIELKIDLSSRGLYDASRANGFVGFKIPASLTLELSAQTDYFDEFVVLRTHTNLSDGGCARLSESLPHNMDEIFRIDFDGRIDDLFRNLEGKRYGVFLRLRDALLDLPCEILEHLL